MDVRNATAPEQFKVTAPEGAPNVLLVLIDDLGFAGTSKFGGPVSTPTFDKLASEGVYYNNFHTTSVCSPTRAALKSGRNHHVNNMGSIVETGTSFPGNTGSIPINVTPVAEMLRLNGYNTGAFGKWHELAAWETNVTGPFTRWPIRQGFEKFYGFLGGETNQWAPFIWNGIARVNGEVKATVINEVSFNEEGKIEVTTIDTQSSVKSNMRNSVRESIMVRPL